MTYRLVMLFGSTTRKRIASSGLRSLTVASSLSCARFVSTTPTRFVSRAMHHAAAPEPMLGRRS